MTLAALVPFLIFCLVVLVVSYAVIRVVELIPGLPPPAAPIIRLIVGVFALIAILQRAAVLFNVAI